MADTTRQEKGSIITFYYAIEKGASLEPYENKELVEALKKEYPECFSNGWYITFLKQAKKLISWMGHREKSTDTSYKYARWGSGGTSDPVDSIPTNKKTDIYDWIWESFPQKQKELFGKPAKKDSWNTTDVYMVKASEESKIKKQIENITNKTFDKIVSNLDDRYSLYIGSINTYLSYLTKNKILIGISLKEGDYGEPQLVPTNIETPIDGIHTDSAKITKALNSWMSVIGDKGKGNNKKVDFRSNSLTYYAEFTIGNYIKRYKYESKIGSIANHATEPRDLVAGARGGYTQASARNGSIPVPKMSEIIEYYSGEKINENIPLDDSDFTKNQIDYWADYFEKLKTSSNPRVPIEFGKITFLGENCTARQFIEKCAILDSTFKSKKKSEFSIKFRSKLRVLRYIYSFIKADKDGKLKDIISEMYFASAKINMKQTDLSGPFIKIQ